MTVKLIVSRVKIFNLSMTQKYFCTPAATDLRTVEVLLLVPRPRPRPGGMAIVVVVWRGRGRGGVVGVSQHAASRAAVISLKQFHIIIVSC